MRTLHLVSHTHWDREWYLTFQQFRLRLVHLMDNVLSLLEHDSNFQYFTLDGQTIILEDYLAIRPERAAEIRHFIQAGRLLIGPWYVLPDEFLVSPEALIRNLLVGQKICREYTSMMKIGYIPDPFGHIGQMPQILRGFDIQSASVMRGLSDEPCEFWWQSPDGSAVLMAYLRDGYGNAAGLPVKNQQRFCDELIRLSDSLASYSAAQNILIMFGTDHMEPPAETSQAVDYANSALQGVRLVHSNLPLYLEALQDDLSQRGVNLPVIYGELRSSKRTPLLPGVLSTRTWIKQRNHACETLLERWAEPFSAWASLVLADQNPSLYFTGERLQNPSGALHTAWQLLLTCQPHDSICGCSIDQVHEEMRPRFDQVEQIGETLTHQSLSALAQAVNTDSSSTQAVQALCVFNPAQGDRTDIVDIDLQLPEDVTTFAIMDHLGQFRPYQVLGSGNEELINVSLSPVEFLNAANNIQDGRIAGNVIQKIKYTIHSDTVKVEVLLSAHGEPALEAFHQAMAEFHALAGKSIIKRFEVRAHSGEKIHLRFLANHVPGPGVRTFWLRSVAEQSNKAVELSPLVRLALPAAVFFGRFPWVSRALAQLSQRRSSAKPPYFIENEFMVVNVKRGSGILKLLDKTTNLVFDGLNHFVDGGDCGDEYNYCPPMHDQVVSQTHLRHIEVQTSSLGQQLMMKLELRLPQSLDATRQARSSETVILPIRCTLSLWYGVRRLEIHTEIDNSASDHRLRVHFRTPFQVDSADYDGHFEIVRRPIAIPSHDDTWVEQPRSEAPQRLFSGLSQGANGMLLAARGLPEVEAITLSEYGSELALTLLRCVGWLSRDDLAVRKGHAGPSIATPGAQLHGKHVFDYAIIPYEDVSEARQLARDFHSPMRCVSTGLHSGKLPPTSNLVEVTSEDPLSINNFVISTIKQSETSEGLVVRGCNLSSETIHFQLRPWRPFAQVKLLRLDETQVGILKPETNGGISYVANPYQILTFQFHD